MNFFSTIAPKSALVLIISVFSAISVSALTPVTVENQVTVSPEPVRSVVYDLVTVRLTDKSVLLDWNTVSEFNNSHFEVERSADRSNFKTVAVVLDGFETNGTGKRYAFKEDISVVKNNVAAYYRLKQIDIFGNITYSEVVKVQKALIAE